jgi:hypothetical protein
MVEEGQDFHRAEVFPQNFSDPFPGKKDMGVAVAPLPEGAAVRLNPAVCGG